MSNEQVAEARAEFERRAQKIRRFIPAEYQAEYQEMVDSAREYADQQYHEGLSMGQYYATGGA